MAFQTVYITTKTFALEPHDEVLHRGLATPWVVVKVEGSEDTVTLRHPKTGKVERFTGKTMERRCRHWSDVAR